MTAPASTAPLASAAGASIMGLSFGAQTDAALKVINASTYAEMEEGYELARNFAQHFAFELPEAEPPLSEDQYSAARTEFVQHMRGRIESQLDSMRKEGCSIGNLVAHNLAPDDVVDIALAGLATFDLSNKILFSAMRNLASSVERMDQPETVRTIFTRPSTIATAALAGLETFLIHKDYLAPSVVGGLALLLCGIFIFNNFMERKAGIVSNESLSNRRLDRMRDLEEVARAHGRLLSEEGNVPHPGKRCPTPNLTARRTAIAMRDPSDKRLGIVRKMEDMTGAQDEPIKYIVAELPGGGGREMRTASEKFAHSDLLLLGERIVGAGTLLYLNYGINGQHIVVDGRSEIFPTSDSFMTTPLSHLVAPNAGLIEVMDVMRPFQDSRVGLIDPIDDVRVFLPSRR